VAGDLVPRRAVSDPLSEADRELLGFAASQSVVLVSQLRALLGLEEDAAAASAGSLVDRGLLSDAPRLRHQAGSYQITRLGLEAIRSRLSVPRIDLRAYWREIAAGWVWLAARVGTFGPAERVYSKREMQAADQNQADLHLEDGAEWSAAIAAKVADASFGMTLESAAAGERAAVHYADLALVFPPGRVTFELELEPTPPRRLERIIAAYKRKANIAASVFLVESHALAKPIQAVAARLEMSAPVHVQPMRVSRTDR
jgi:hypothetical protein